MPDFDRVRQDYLARLHAHSGRNTILYASGWLQQQNKSSTPRYSIEDEDMQAFMEVNYGLQGQELDLILHSPGGSVEATEAIVSYLRGRFSYIRVIVPQLAMSAATLLACSANEIMLGKHSSLGPTDPQVRLATPLGMGYVPAQSILDQFALARKESANPKLRHVWKPMLDQYGPHLLDTCQNALDLSKDLAQQWLSTYMFGKSRNRVHQAKSISSWLADHKHFKSHSRHISRETLSKKGLIVRELEADNLLQDLVLSVFHATTLTFTGLSVEKIVENHMGRTFAI